MYIFIFVHSCRYIKNKHQKGKNRSQKLFKGALWERGHRIIRIKTKGIQKNIKRRSLEITISKSWKLVHGRKGSSEIPGFLFGGD